MLRLLMTAFLLAASGGALESPAASLEARRKAFDSLLAEQWEYTLSHSPEFASILGDKRWNDKVSDLSAEEVERDLAKSREFLAGFEAIDTSGFPEQEALTKTLLVRRFKEEIEDARFKTWEMPVTQISGIHLDAPRLVALLSFKTVKDYEDYIGRARQLPKMLDDTIANMRRGMADGLMPPKFLLGKVVSQAEGIAKSKPEESPFARPLSKLPKDFSVEDRSRLRQALLSAIRESVLPAYAKFAAFVKEEYAPKGRSEPGMWSLPEGVARYATAVKRSTTTNQTPEEIHAIGLSEVARIEGEMLAVGRKMSYKDLKSFNVAIEKDPKRRAHSREEILNIYRGYIAGMKPELPRLFGRLPKADIEVDAVEKFREKEASGAQYEQGAKDGSRPGRVMINTGEPESRKTISMESTAYHEGAPGHHLQISIAQELENLPPVRQQSFYTAFVEGWAFYSERLGKEIGFYKDPYSDYGRLQDEMLRAIRLVVDTGFHAKEWTRDRVVAYFHDHSAIDEIEVQNETDRYISWPGQALAYKIGQLKILELREKAKKDLGSKFDIRRFHDAVLGAGALPMDVLEDRISIWIRAEKGL